MCRKKSIFYDVNVTSITGTWHPLKEHVFIYACLYLVPAWYTEVDAHMLLCTCLCAQVHRSELGVCSFISLGLTV